MSAAPSPPAGAAAATVVDVWLLAEADVPAMAVALRAHELLSVAERDKLQRLRTPGARTRYLGARLLSRGVLAQRTGLAPGTLTFDAGLFGRPELHPNPWELRFNLSHTDGLLACVVTVARPCGIDLEGYPPNPDVVRFGAQWLSDSERARIERLADRGDEDERDSEFVDTWVLKEAYTKALGTGFQHRFDAFELRRDAAGRVLLDDPTRPADECQRWQFLLCRAGPAHRLAVAVCRDRQDPPELPVRIQEFGLDNARRNAVS